MVKKKGNRGGARKGAGRKKKAPTTTVSFRVVVEHAEPVKEVVRQYLNSFEKTEKGEKKKKKKNSV